MNASVIKVIPQCCIELRLISRGIVIVPNIMQLFAMYDKNIWYGAHNWSKAREKSMQWYPLSAFFFS